MCVCVYVLGLTHKTNMTSSSSSFSSSFSSFSAYKKADVRDALRTEGRSYLMFYSKSIDELPFQGKGEWRSETDKSAYSGLKKGGNFRKVLSAFYATAKPIFYMTPHQSVYAHYATYEHLHHAMKFFETAPTFAKLFSLESGSEFCRCPIKAKAAGGKTGVFTERVGERGSKQKKKKKVVKTRLRPTKYVSSPSFTKNNEPYRFEALMAKFSQDKTAREALLATENCALVHFRREGVVHEKVFERVRDVLRRAA